MVRVIVRDVSNNIPRGWLFRLREITEVFSGILSAHQNCGPVLKYWISRVSRGRWGNIVVEQRRTRSGCCIYKWTATRTSDNCLLSAKFIVVHTKYVSYAEE